MHNGRREGVFTTWHDNGKKSKEGTYKNGKEEGVWTDFSSDDGQKLAEGTYKADSGEERRFGGWTPWKEGVWTVWRYGKKSEEKYKGGKRRD